MPGKTIIGNSPFKRENDILNLKRHICVKNCSFWGTNWFSYKKGYNKFSFRAKDHAYLDNFDFPFFRSRVYTWKGSLEVTFFVCMSVCKFCDFFFVFVLKMGHLICPSMGPKWTGIEPVVNRKWTGSVSEVECEGSTRAGHLLPAIFLKLIDHEVKGMNRTFSTLFMILLRCIMSEKIRSALLTQVFLGSDNLNIF